VGPAAAPGTFPAKLLAAVLAAAFLAAAFFVLAGQVGGNAALADFDWRVTEAVLAWRTPAVSRVMWLFTILGNTPVLASLAAAAVIALAARGAWARALLIAGALASAQGISTLAKAVFQRPRPPEAMMLIQAPTSHSYPSGHAMIIAVFCGLLVFLVFRDFNPDRERLGGVWPTRQARHAGHVARHWAQVALQGGALLVALLVVLEVGFSRVYLGVHWVTDAFGGWCVGGAWLGAVLAAFFAWERSRWALRDSAPLGTSSARVGLAVVLCLVVVGAAIAAALIDPLSVVPAAR
jgi:membrane-associated phospholipid phosphatase